MRRRESLLVVGIIGTAFAVGCSRQRGGDVTGSSGSAAPQSVSVISGKTGQPVQSLNGLTAVEGQTLTLQAPGFFTFRTAFAGAPIVLWPADDGFLSAHETRTIVYSGQDPGMLTRLAPSVTSVSLVPDAGIRAFPWAMARVTTAANTLSVSHAALEFAVDGGGFQVALEVNAVDEALLSMPTAAAAAYVYKDGSTITKAKVVFRSLQIQGFWHSEDNFETAVVHEVIHTTGLDHLGAEDPPGIMSTSGDAYKHRAPTERERLIMKMQYERLPGTTLAGMTESAPGVSARSSKSRWHLVCVR